MRPEWIELFATDAAPSGLLVPAILRSSDYLGSRVMARIGEGRPWLIGS